MRQHGLICFSFGSRASEGTTPKIVLDPWYKFQLHVALFQRSGDGGRQAFGTAEHQQHFCFVGKLMGMLKGKKLLEPLEHFQGYNF